MPTVYGVRFTNESFDDYMNPTKNTFDSYDHVYSSQANAQAYIDMQLAYGSSTHFEIIPLEVDAQMPFVEYITRALQPPITDEDIANAPPMAEIEWKLMQEVIDNSHHNLMDGINSRSPIDV